MHAGCLFRVAVEEVPGIVHWCDEEVDEPDLFAIFGILVHVAGN